VLINLEPFGRLGNRLFLAAHLTAFCRKWQVLFSNPAMAPYDRLFPALAPFARPVDRPFQVARSWLPGSMVFRYWGAHDLNFDRQPLPQLVDPLKAGKDVFFRGWLFRGFESIQRFRDEIVTTFRPHDTVLSWADHRLAEARVRGEVVVGVHIRWEDYRGTPNFLEPREYLQRMTGVAALLAPRRAVFLVFSNEPLTASDFSPHEVVLAQGSPIQDLTLMSRCDFLMAPPSTFSGWASFSGNVPLVTLSRDQGNLELEDFHIVRG